MQLPKHYETFIPILSCLSDGKTIPYSDLVNMVLDKHFKQLPQELLNKRLKTGGLSILNRIAWGKTYLKFGKYIDSPERGLVRITEKGLKALSKGKLSLKEIETDPDYLSHMLSQKNKKKRKTADEDINSRLENGTPEDLLEAGISAIEARVKSELMEKLKSINPYFFEEIILKLLRCMGYGEFIMTPKSRDGGIDGVINQDFLGLEKIYIQAKRYGENKVRETDIRNFIGAMSGDTSKGVFVTTSTFDEGAKRKAQIAHHKISLIDGEKLVELMLKYDIGVKTRETYKIKELDSTFFEF